MAVVKDDALTGPLVRTYDEIVAEARALGDDYQWKIGDLAGEVRIAYGEHKLQQFADDLTVPYATVKDLRRVAAAYQKDERSSLCSWSVHQVLAGQDDRAELVRIARRRSRSLWNSEYIDDYDD